MNTKRIVRWIVVLVLLVALPVITAALAQGEEPAMPVLSEIGESLMPEAANVNESESNNTRASANPMKIGDVMGGKIGAAGDVDYFKFNMPYDPGYVLIDVDAVSIGSQLNSEVCLENSSGTTLACNDDSDTVDSLLFYNPFVGDYYIKVTHKPNNAGGNNYNYELILSTPLLISAQAANFAAGGDVGGIHFYSEDILAHSDLNNGAQKWVLFFDGSDVGLQVNITNIASHTGAKILLTTAANRTLPGIANPVTPWDFFVFDGTRYGPNTQGTFVVGFRGVEQELTTAAERVDAIDGFTRGIESDPLMRGCFGYPVSTVGIIGVTGPFGLMKQDDEDIFCKVYNPNAGGWGRWDWFFDVKGKFNAPASEPAPGNVPGLAAKDVFAMAYNDKDEKVYLTILQGGPIHGNATTQKDIFALNYPSYAWDGFVFKGPDHGWNYNIDAIEYLPTAINITPVGDIDILPIGDSLTYGWRLRQGPATQTKPASSCYQASFTGTAITAANRKVFASYRLPLYQMFNLQTQYTFDFMGTNATGSDKTYNFNGYPNKGIALPSADDINFVGYSSRTTQDVNRPGDDGNANTPDVQFRLALALPTMKAQTGFEPPEVALIHLGTNDINKNIENTTTTQMQGILTQLRTAGIGGNPNITVYIAQIIPVGNPSSCSTSTFAADCAEFTFACGNASPVETFNSALKTWCGATGTGNVLPCPNLKVGSSEVYLVNQYEGFDKENWVLPSDEVHVTRYGECRMALRWYEALRATKYPNLPARDATFCSDYPND